MKNKYRDHYCDKLTEKEIGKIVKVAGFVENIRDHGGVLFLDLRDYTGEIQIVSNIEGIFDKITKQSSMSITGKIRKRSPEDYNEKISTGTIESCADSLIATIIVILFYITTSILYFIFNFIIFIISFSIPFFPV